MSKCTRNVLTVQAVQEAIEQHDALVHAFIRRQGGGDIPYEEALQAGRIGLWHAIQGYDPERGTTFASYAWVAIWRQIHRRAKELRRDTDVGFDDLNEETLETFSPFEINVRLFDYSPLERLLAAHIYVPSAKGQVPFHPVSMYLLSLFPRFRRYSSFLPTSA